MQHSVWSVSKVRRGKRGDPPTLAQTTRRLLARSFPGACPEQLDQAAALLADDIRRGFEDGPEEPERDDLTGEERDRVAKLRHILGTEQSSPEVGK
ncbi:hypothetical protein Kpho01_19660 [Kitasatospora phosalacinea]|uniref:Uncharacterized protein n=1 Tax=Kitasatospora phosalacinea TaxID=2065 RepID=A0A9W6UNW3_9ACTN|nr:hypothetical protein Kpho01_19660 [Kitasatospora phosalacinea]